MESIDRCSSAIIASESNDDTTAAQDEDIHIKFERDHLSETLTTIDQTSIKKRKAPRQSWLAYMIGNVYAQDDPRELSNKRKSIILFILALGGVSGPLGSMIYMPGLLSVARDLHTTISAVNGSVSAFVVFMGVAPLIWASLSDQYGRKRMYLLSNLISLVASVICAFSQNIGMLIVFRALQSCGANAGLTLGAGVIADMIPVADRGKAYGFFYIGPLVGPVIGPTLGGFLCQYLGWQSTFYFSAAISGILFLMTAFLLPETLRKQRVVTKYATKSNALQSLKRDFKPILQMLQDWTVISITAYNTVIFSSLYFLNPIIGTTMQNLYGYSEWQAGLCYLPFGVGLMIGSIISGRHSDTVLKTTKSDRIIPELRLRAATPAFFLIPAGFLIYGWTVEYKVGVYAPMIGLFVYALGQMWAFTPTSVYLVDSKPGSSATAVGITNCFRSIVGAVTTVVSSIAVDALGPGILFTILATINIANIVFIALCYIYGDRWRTSFENKIAQSCLTDDKALPSDINEFKAMNSRIQEEHQSNVHLARITSKHSAV